MLGPGFEIQLRNALQERNRELEHVALRKSALARQNKRDRNANIRLKLGSALIAIGARIHGASEPCPQPRVASS